MTKRDALTDAFVRKVKEPGKYTDGASLYLVVIAGAERHIGKLWRMDFQHAGKRGTLALGRYPDVSLADARKRRDEAREQLAAGISPSQAKRAAKATQAIAAANTFEVIAREFHAQRAASWSASYTTRWLERMEKDMFPYLGRLPVTSITAPMLLESLRRVEKRGAVESAHKLLQYAGQVFRFAIHEGRAERSPASDLRGALAPVVVKHMAAVTEPVKAGELLRAIDGYTGQPTTRVALQIAALIFQRPANVREMQWAWIDFTTATMTIPAGAMKRRVHDKLNGKAHLVPLARQAVAILRELQPLTGHGKYVFPSLRTGEQPMSTSTMNAALRRLGFAKDEMVSHGFRSMAQTMILERFPNIAPDAIEAQLAHKKAGPLGDAYDRAEYREQRRQMMQTWADYLDKLRAGADVIRLRA